MPERHEVAKTSEIPAAGGHCVEVGGKEIALFVIEGAYYAIDNLCPHAGGPLSEGEKVGQGVTCPWHAWTFDFATGASSVNPAIKVHTYPVVVEGDGLFIEL